VLHNNTTEPDTATPPGDVVPVGAMDNSWRPSADVDDDVDAMRIMLPDMGVERL
jgi:hypothetical protein